MTAHDAAGARLRKQYAAYNAAYNRRLDPGGAEELQRARLDLLLALAQAGEPLSKELLEQATADATVVWRLGDAETAEAYPDGAAAERTEDVPSAG